MKGLLEPDRQEFQICDREKTHKLQKSNKEKNRLGIIFINTCEYD